MVPTLRQLLEAFDSPDEITGEVRSGRTLVRIYLSPGSAEMGPLDTPLPPFLCFSEDRVYGSQEKGGARLPLPEELVHSGIELLRLYDPRVYLRALDYGVARQVGRALAYPIEAMGTQVLGMSPIACNWVRCLSGDEYRTVFSRRSGTLRFTVQDGGDSRPAIIRYSLPGTQ